MRNDFIIEFVSDDLIKVTVIENNGSLDTFIATEPNIMKCNFWQSILHFNLSLYLFYVKVIEKSKSLKVIGIL